MFVHKRYLEKRKYNTYILTVVLSVCLFWHHVKFTAQGWMQLTSPRSGVITF